MYLRQQRPGSALTFFLLVKSNAPLYSRPVDDLAVMLPNSKLYELGIEPSKLELKDNMKFGAAAAILLAVAYFLTNHYFHTPSKYEQDQVIELSLALENNDSFNPYVDLWQEFDGKNRPGLYMYSGTNWDQAISESLAHFKSSMDELIPDGDSPQAQAKRKATEKEVKEQIGLTGIMNDLLGPQIYSVPYLDFLKRLNPEGKKGLIKEYEKNIKGPGDITPAMTTNNHHASAAMTGMIREKLGQFNQYLQTTKQSMSNATSMAFAQFITVTTLPDLALSYVSSITTPWFVMQLLYVEIYRWMLSIKMHPVAQDIQKMLIETSVKWRLGKIGKNVHIESTESIRDIGPILKDFYRFRIKATVDLQWQGSPINSEVEKLFKQQFPFLENSVRILSVDPMAGEQYRVSFWIDAAMLINQQSSTALTGVKHARNRSQFGGIDANAANLNLIIKRDGNGVALPLAQQDLAQLSNLQGLEPIIFNIQPAEKSPFFAKLLNS